MSPAFRQIVARLTKVGIAFLLALALFLTAYFLGSAGWAALLFFVLLPLGAILLFRGLRTLKRNGLWSVRNRLLCVYALIGVLPLLLLLALIGIGAWAITSELAVYLATSALQNRIRGLDDMVQALHKLPVDQQLTAAPEILLGEQTRNPGTRLYIAVDGISHRFPPDAQELHLKPSWKNVEGLAVYQSKFYGMAHYSGNGEEITALAPLTDEIVENLVPNSGVISLFEVDNDKPQKSDRRPASAGALRASETKTSTPQNPDYRFSYNYSADPNGSQFHLPPPAFRFDIPVGYAAFLPHFHLDDPNKTYRATLWIYSRPSAVLGAFFTSKDILRGYLFDSIIAFGILFFLVELGAVFLGARLARRLTGAVNALYEGTRRVIHGDFSHRIPVYANDQLGELGQSFNQMTGNLERLLVIEKEKERLQSEIEIAREVQGQLYPKQAPPNCGLKLSVQCDPARMVSGDYYDYQELEGKRIAFAIGDVAGKGISAALLMATLQATLRTQLTQFRPVVRNNSCTTRPEIDVAKLVSALNKQLYAHTSPEKYATFFFAVFDEVTRSLAYTNAGHLSPLLFRGAEVVPLESNGMVVGAFPFAKYDESCLQIDPGDLLVCYTDGITEPESPYGEEFGEERLIDLVRKHHYRDDNELISIILEAVRSWKGGPELHDDMTLLIARGVPST